MRGRIEVLIRPCIFSPSNLYRKKKKSYTDSERAEIKDDVERSGRVAEIKGEGSVQAGSSSGSAAVPEGRKKTAAEEKYDKIQEERVRTKRRFVLCRAC